MAEGVGIRYQNEPDCEGKGFVIIGGLRSTESSTCFPSLCRVLLCLLEVLATCCASVRKLECQDGSVTLGVSSRLSPIFIPLHISLNDRFYSSQHAT